MKIKVLSNDLLAQGFTIESRGMLDLRIKKLNEESMNFSLRADFLVATFADDPVTYKDDFATDANVKASFNAALAYQSILLRNKVPFSILFKERI